MRISLSFLLFFCVQTMNAQTFEDFLAIERPIFIEMVDALPDLCDLNTGHWVNSSAAYPNSEHYGKFTIVHFGSFDNLESLADIEELVQLQKDYPFIRVLVSLNSKFDYPRNDEDILFELEKRRIPLPFFVDEGFALWECMDIEYWPTTLFVGPNGNVLEKKEGRLDINVLRNNLPTVLSRLAPYLEKNPEPFYGMPPGRWNKRSILEFPAGLATVEREKIVFVSDLIGNRILGFTVGGDVLYCIGTGEKGWKDGTLNQASFNGPWGLAYNPESNVLYVADSRNHAIRKVDLTEESVETLMGVGRPGPGGQNKIIGANSPINHPTGLLLEGYNLYIAMTGTSEIWKMDIRTEVAERIAGSGIFGFSEGNALTADLAAPLGLARDQSGALFFTDAQASALRYVDDGRVETEFGQGIFSFGYGEGRNKDVEFQFPQGIESVGDMIYIADTYNHAVRLVEPFKGSSETLAGDPDLPGYRNGEEPLFRLPMDLAVLDEKLFIADGGNGMVRSYDFVTREMKGVQLFNYGCLGRGELLGLTDLRDGETLILGNGLNEVTYRLDLGKQYELDPTAFSDASMNTRHPGFEMTESDLSDGKIAFTFMPDGSAGRPAMTMEFSIFFRSTENPELQYHKKISFYHRVKIDPEAPFKHEINVSYDPDKGRD